MPLTNFYTLRGEIPNGLDRDYFVNMDNEKTEISGINKKKKDLDENFLDNLCLRFPTIGIKLFKKLDDKTIMSLKTANGTISKLLEDNRYFWIRKVQSYINRDNVFYNSWKMAIRKTPAPILKEILDGIEGYFIYFNKSCSEQLCPLHIASFLGNLNLVKHIVEKTKDCSIKNEHGWTSLHFAVLKGHLKIRNNSSIKFHREHPIKDLMNKIGMKKKTGMF